MNRILFQLLPVLVGCTVLSASATTVYKTLDAEGNTVYSDQAPDSEDLLVEQIDLPDYSAQTNIQHQQLDQITKTADRLKQDRLEREQLKLKQQQAHQAALAPVYPQTIVEENYYYPYPRHLRHFRDFPSIHDPHHPFHNGPRDHSLLRDNDRRSNRGGLLVPKSKLLTP